MTAIVDIWNLGLFRIGQTVFVQSPDEDSKPANYCKLLYPVSRDAVLRDFDWGFASKTATSALVDTDINGWAYAYQYPTDCLAIREIVDTTKTHQKIPYKVGLIGAAKVIFTDHPEAIFRYTAKVEDSTFFDASYVEALSWKMAYELAGPITKKDTIQDKMAKGYGAALDNAQVNDANEGVPIDEPEAPWLEGRG